MPNKLHGKPCRQCGILLAGVKRRDRHAYYYPRVCETCRPLVGPRGASHPRWNGGRSVGINGYVLVSDPTARGGRVTEHRAVWIAAHGPIPPGQHVHHLNGIRDDNRLENLVLMEGRAHAKHHNPPLTRWATHYDCCVQCGTTESRHSALGLCVRCASKRARQRAKAMGKPWAMPAPRAGAWARQYAQCIVCGTTATRHAGKGRCAQCYLREWGQRRPPRVRR